MGIRTYDSVQITGLSASGTTDSSGSWNTSVDLDSFVTVPSGATGVVLLLNNGNSSPRWCGVRTPGKTTAQILKDMTASERGTTVFCQLGTGNTIDLYCENATDVTFRIVGVTDYRWNYLDIDSPTTISSTGSTWASRTLSVTSGSIAAVVDMAGLWRPSGETTSIGSNSTATGHTLVKLNGSLQAEFNTGNNRRIIAEISGGINWNSWLAVNETPTFNSTWNTSGLSSSGKTAAIIQNSKTGTAVAYGFRRTGSSLTASAGSSPDEFFVAPLNGSGQFDVWAETGGSGETNYVHAWTNDFADNAPTLSSPTPSGTLGTQGQATLGATSTQSTGTFHSVVSSTQGDITGITAAQILAEQYAGGGAATFADASAVSDTTPEVTVTGLSANTTYYYAVMHRVGTSNSNVVTGSFTTAVATSTATLTLRDGSGTLLNAQTLNFWTRTTIYGAAVDGGTNGLSVTSNASGVFSFTGLTIAAGSGYITVDNPSNVNYSANYPVTFIASA